MNVVCPSCGAGMDLDVLLAHEDSRGALARLLAISTPQLGKVAVQYLRLFKPATRAMSHGRVVALLEQLLPDIERGAIARAGRDWPAPADAWRVAMERVLEQRDNGRLTLPFKSHGYLYEVLQQLADQAEAAAERDAEAARRRRTADVGAELQPAAAILATPAPAPAAPYSGPSKAAQAIKAQIAAQLALRRGTGWVDCGECPNVSTGCREGYCLKAVTP